MPNALENSPKVVGAKQTKRAISDGRATALFLAQDALPDMTEPIAALAEQANIPIHREATMKQLGILCGIAVGASVAATVILAE